MPPRRSNHPAPPAFPINHARDQLVSYALQAVEETAILANPTPLEMMLVALPLRALLIEGYLNKTARSHNIALNVPQPLNDFLLNHTPASDIKFGMCGNVNAWGGKVVGGFLYTRTLGTQGKKWPPNVENRRGTISEFMDQTVLVVNGFKVTRRNVILYVANKVGFAHVSDSSAKPENIALDTARAAFGYDDTASDNLKISYDDRPLHVSRAPFTPHTRRIDSVLMQIFISCKFLRDTPTLQELRQIIDRT